MALALGAVGAALFTAPAISHSQAPTPTPSTTREMLTWPRTYFFRSDGNDGNDGLADSPQRAFRTIQHAINVARQLDFGDHIVTIRHGNEGPGERVFTTSNLIEGIVSGAGSLIITGYPLPGRTAVVTPNRPCFWQQNSKAQVEYRHMRLEGGQQGQIHVANGSIGMIGNGMVFDHGATAHLSVHDGLSMITALSSGYKIVGGADYHLLLNGANAFVEYARIEMVGEPKFHAFIGAMTTGGVQVTGNTFTGAARGLSAVANTNAAVNMMGSGAGVLPGSTGVSDQTGGVIAEAVIEGMERQRG